MIIQRIVFLVTRNLTQTVKYFLGSLGAIWLLVEFVSFFKQDLIEKDYKLFYGSLILSIIWAFFKSFPIIYVGKKSKLSHSEIEIRIGKLLDLKDCDIAIPSSNCYDTNFPQIIHGNTLKAKLIKKEFGGNSTALDKAIESFLKKNQIIGEIDSEKKIGKKHRYPFGTTVVIESHSRNVYLTSMSNMTNEGVSQASKESIWLGLCGLWNVVRVKGHLKPIALPIWGSGYSRARSSRIGLIQMAILSFVIATNESKVSNKLIISVLEEDYSPELFHDLRDFLNTIEF